MLFCEERFYREFLDRSIPQMQEAAERFLSGDEEGAAGVFASYLRAHLEPQRLFSTLFNRRRMTEDGGCSPNTIVNADRAAGYTLTSVGFPYTFEPGKIDWEINPTFNEYKEWTWQLSRHNEFFDLATAYRVTKDEKYARTFADMILSWIRQAECPENISGYSTKCWRTIEAGIRMLGSWQYAIHAFLFSPSLTDRDWVTIFRSVYDHAYRLRGFCTSHNWLIMEMDGLLNIGVLYPFFAGAAEWREYAIGRLLGELKEQLYPDGFQYELTTNYHGVNLYNYYCAAELLCAYDREVPPEFSEALHRMYLLYAKLVRPNHRLPDLNDGNRRDIRREMRDALVLFPDDPVFRFFASEGREGRAPDFLSTVLPYSGIAVMRTGWGEDAIWALFDGGPFGNAHQHEDKLQVQIYAYGEDMLADTGSYAYDSSAMRKYVLSTRAHSTGLVDGFGQNRRGKYRWESSMIGKRAEELSFRADDEREIAQSFYDEGYGPQSVPVRHDRKFVFLKRGVGGSLPFFLVLDRFTAQDDAEHLFEVSFQLGTDPILAQGRSVTAEHPEGKTFRMVSDSCPKILIGQYAPEYIGWKPIHSPLDHEHAPAPVISYTKRGVSACFATVLFPSPDGRIPEIRVGIDGESAVLTVGETTERFGF